MRPTKHFDAGWKSIINLHASVKRINHDKSKSASCRTCAQSLVLCALKISRVKDLKHCQNIQRAWRQSILLHDNWQEIAEAQDSHENMHDKKTPYLKRKQDSTAIQSVCHQHAPQKNQARHHRKSTYRYIEIHESAVNGYHPKIYKTHQLDPLIHLRFQQKNIGASVLLGFQT